MRRFRRIPPLATAILLIAQLVWAAIPATDNFSGTFSTNWTTAQGSLSNSGGVVTSGSAGENTGFWKTSTDTFSADQSSEATIGTMAPGGNYVAVRMSGSGATTQAYIFGPASNGGNCQLFVQTSGTSYAQLGADYGACSTGNRAGERG